MRVGFGVVMAASYGTRTRFVAFLTISRLRLNRTILSARGDTKLFRLESPPFGERGETQILKPRYGQQLIIIHN